MGAQVPEGAVQGAGSDLDQFGSRCAEVAATRTLARNLNLDLALLEVISAEAVQWPNSSLGCPEEGRAYAPIIVSGYSVVLDQKGERYEIHTNQHGSAIAICDE